MVVMFILTATTNAQHKEKGHLENFNEFLAADSTPANLDDNAYLICCVYPKDVTEFYKHNSIKTLRQLNDSVLVISINKKDSIPYLSSRFKWIKRANADWKMSPSLLLQMPSLKPTPLTPIAMHAIRGDHCRW